MKRLLILFTLLLSGCVATETPTVLYQPICTEKELLAELHLEQARVIATEARLERIERENMQLRKAVGR